MNYRTSIGLEIHIELKTKSKMYCGCTTEFGGVPNTHCCPLCLGLPGALPTINKEAVIMGIKTGLALNCEISEFNAMDRKNYFYPDLPKGYQITQQYHPICRDGYLDIEVDNDIKRIGIERIHLEEDAGKLLHSTEGSHSLVDYNRAGIPLIEIVTKPDMSSPKEAIKFMEELRLILLYLGVSDCRMEEGSIRCDVNLSIRPRGQKQLGRRTETKNINSLRALHRAIEYEEKRQSKILDSGGRVESLTLRWDDTKGHNIPMRHKEEPGEYRYFPDPDLLPFRVTKDDVFNIGKVLPELPGERRERYINKYGLPSYDAHILTSSQDIGDFFEKALELYGNGDTKNKAKTLSNWIMTEVMRFMKEDGGDASEIKLKESNLVELLRLVDEAVISGSVAKEVLAEMWDKDISPREIVKEKNLSQISDIDKLHDIITNILKENPGPVEDYRKGKKKALGYLVGQTMKETKGKANPQMVNQILRDRLHRE